MRLKQNQKEKQILNGVLELNNPNVLLISILNFWQAFLSS